MLKFQKGCIIAKIHHGIKNIQHKFINLIKSTNHALKLIGTCCHKSINFIATMSLTESKHVITILAKVTLLSFNKFVKLTMISNMQLTSRTIGNKILLTTFKSWPHPLLLPLCNLPHFLIINSPSNIL